MFGIKNKTGSHEKFSGSSGSLQDEDTEKGIATSELREIFDSSDKISRKWIILTLLIVFVLTVLSRVYQVNNIQEFFTVDKEARQLYVSIGLSIATSLAAGLIFARAHRVEEDKKLKRLRGVADQRYLLELLQATERYRGAWIRDHNIYIKLTPHDNPALLNVTIKHKYSKKFIKDPLIFVVYRLQEGTSANYLQSISKERFVHEWVWQNDETTMPHGVELVDLYNVENVLVEGVVCPVERRLETNKIVFMCDLPTGKFDPQQPQRIEYTIRLPIESESVLYVTHDYPTLDASVVFDCKDIATTTDVYAAAIGGLQDGPVPRNTESAHEIEYRHFGWLSPQNGYVLAWWKKST